MSTELKLAIGIAVLICLALAAYVVYMPAKPQMEVIVIKDQSTPALTPSAPGKAILKLNEAIKQGI